jgi:hypothetical protein
MTFIQMLCLAGLPLATLTALLFIQLRMWRRYKHMPATTPPLDIVDITYEPSYRKELDELVERMNKRKSNV